jgi:hypothetical protein
LQSKEQLFRVKVATCKAALKVAQITRGVFSNEQHKSMNQFLLLSYFLAPALEKLIQQQSRELHLQTVIDTRLIDTVLASEQAEPVNLTNEQ